MLHLTDLDVALMGLGATILAWVVWVSLLIYLGLLFPGHQRDLDAQEIAEKPATKPAKPESRTVSASSFIIPSGEWIADVNRRAEPWFYYTTHQGRHRSGHRPHATGAVCLRAETPPVSDDTLAQVYQGGGIDG